MSFSIEVKNELEEKARRMHDGDYVESGVIGALPQTPAGQKAWLRGAFLCCGSVSDPRKSYHLDLTLDEPALAETVRDVMKSFDIEGRISSRKGKYVVYLKDGDSIADMLGLLGATKAMLELENVRVLRDISGRVNRKVNCETANLNKTVSAGLAQVRQIELIKSKRRYAQLPSELKAVAELRIANPDLPIAEIGAMLDPPLGKSGIYHRFERIKRIADELSG